MSRLEKMLVTMCAMVLGLGLIVLAWPTAEPARSNQWDLHVARITVSKPPRSVHVVARTLFDECRGEPIEGRRLVASTLWRDAGGDPARLEEAALTLFRYSCWDRKPRDIRTLTAMPTLRDRIEVRAWRECLELSDALHSGTFRPVGLQTEDLVLLPTNYHRNDGRRRPWAGEQYVVGNHRFYFDRAQQG